MSLCSTMLAAVLVAAEPPGNSPQVPIPGKLKILESRNLKVWEEMDVDYRAVAQSAVIAVADPRHIWVATDTGAILGLVGRRLKQTTVAEVVLSTFCPQRKSRNLLILSGIKVLENPLSSSFNS